MTIINIEARLRRDRAHEAVIAASAALGGHMEIANGSPTVADLREGYAAMGEAYVALGERIEEFDAADQAFRK